MKELNKFEKLEINGGSDESKGLGFILAYKFTRAAQELLWRFL